MRFLTILLRYFQLCGSVTICDDDFLARGLAQLRARAQSVRPQSPEIDEKEVESSGKQEAKSSDQGSSVKPPIGRRLGERKLNRNEKKLKEKCETDNGK